MASIENHPDYQRMVQETQQMARQEQAARENAKLEEQALRQKQGAYIKAQYEEQVEKYEKLRQELHSQVGLVWQSVQEFNRLTGSNPPTFAEAKFNEIHVPSLKPNDLWSTGFSTTRAAVMAWFASAGKKWGAA